MDKIQGNYRHKMDKMQDMALCERNDSRSLFSNTKTPENFSQQII